MAAPAPSWRLGAPVLLALALALLPAPAALDGALDGASPLSCFYNSKANISCAWSRPGGPRAPACSVHAKSDKRPWSKSCELFPAGAASWACNLVLDEDADFQSLTSADTLNLTVTCHQGGLPRMVTTRLFKPFENLRLLAPYSLRVTHTEPHSCNVTWKVSQVSHYIENYLVFAVRLRTSGQRWEEVAPLLLNQNQQWISLETLAPDTPYELQVQVRSDRERLQVQSPWSPWSRPLAFRTSPKVPEEEILAYPWLGHVMVGVSGFLGLAILAYLLVNYIGPWLKKVLKCHIPDPSEFFAQLSLEHGGDFQKWLSSPFPSSSFSWAGPAPEISPLEVLDRAAKPAQLLRRQQEKAPSPSPSSHSLASCFTNQGYFFFHLPDALEVESCQVYFTYDPCAQEEAEEAEEAGPGAPEGSLLPALPAPPGEDDAYCTFPPGEGLLLFSPSLAGGPPPRNAGLGRPGPGEARPPPAWREEVPGDWGGSHPPPGTPTPGAPDPLSLQPPPGPASGAAEDAGPDPGPEGGSGLPWGSPPGPGGVVAPAPCLALNTDAYLSLQELQDQDPAPPV